MKTKKQKPVEIKLNLPKWIKWVAKDRNGCIYGHNFRPKEQINSTTACYWIDGGKIIMLNNLTDIKIKGNWRKSLRRVVNGKLVMP